MNKALKYLITLSFVFGTASAFSQNSPPPESGISFEEAMKQANELLRQHGINPSDHNEEHSHEPPQQPTNSVSTFQPLTLSQARQDKDTWPAKVDMQATFELGDGSILSEGTSVTFQGFANSRELYVLHNGYRLTIAADATNFLSKVNDIASGQAKNKGFKGRMLEIMDEELFVKNGNAMQSTTADIIDDADLYLFYNSSAACGWSKRTTPILNEQIAEIEKQFPGKLKVIHVSSDQNMQGLLTQYDEVNASAALLPAKARNSVSPYPYWYFDTYLENNPNAEKQMLLPSMMLVTASGKVVDSAMRIDRDESQLKNTIERLPEYVASSESIRPKWMSMNAVYQEQPNQSVPNNENKPKTRAFQTVNGEIVNNTDPTIIGPEPYTLTLRDGTDVPGLVLYDKLSTGSRIPALTLHAYPANEKHEGYYLLAFRQVQGKTYGSKPLLMSWFKSQTRTGSFAQQDLNTIVGEYKAAYTKFGEWRQTAIKNQVSNFQKEMYVLPMTVHYHPAVLSASVIPGQEDGVDTDLEVTFIVSKDPNKASLKGARWSLNKYEIDAFERLIPQIDVLVTQMPAEILRTASAREQQNADEKRVNSLFN